ncbi:MAG: HD domain-containing protein [Candidatus Magasanikbacteria bacterium]|nr:HD domain-containing protein [Candidatus Magasanikbacteria bacterium]MBT4547015.1 HD domain-containing protein [Candidatus Magasanikbacteria bacterium]MBT6819061.1 HD domain-containing protein [Candidatus Magasanikbacteria bacterium]
MDRFEEKFRKALEFLESSDIGSPNKPVIPHVKRVGELLYKKGFEDEVVVSGILHDMLEWSSATEKELQEKFGDTVLEIVKANSKNRSITDNYERKIDMVGRCQKIGDPAMAIRVVDVFDSFCYYSEMKNKKEIDRCLANASLWKDDLSENLKNIFGEQLNKIL